MCLKFYIDESCRTMRYKIKNSKKKSLKIIFFKIGVAGKQSKAIIILKLLIPARKLDFYSINFVRLRDNFRIEIGVVAGIRSRGPRAIICTTDKLPDLQGQYKIKDCRK